MCAASTHKKRPRTLSLLLLPRSKDAYALVTFEDRTAVPPSNLEAFVFVSDCWGSNRETLAHWARGLPLNYTPGLDPA